MGWLLDKFAAFGQRKLRVGQLKILYQNQAASIFLLEYKRNLVDVSRIGGFSFDEMVRSVESISRALTEVNAMIIELGMVPCLEDGVGSELIAMNRYLKIRYHEIADINNRGSIVLGSEAWPGFIERFTPWHPHAKFGEQHWEHMFNLACKHSGMSK